MAEKRTRRGWQGGDDPSSAGGPISVGAIAQPAEGDHIRCRGNANMGMAC